MRRISDEANKRPKSRDSSSHCALASTPHRALGRRPDRALARAPHRLLASSLLRWCGEDDRIAAWLLNPHLAHAVRRHPLERYRIALKFASHLVEVRDFDVKKRGGRALWHKRRRVLASAFKRLQHQLRVTVYKDDKAEPVSFGDFNRFCKAHTIDPKRKRLLDFVDYKNRCDFHFCVVLCL